MSKQRTIALAAVLALAAGSVATASTGQVLPLRENWKLQSSAKIDQGGSTLSTTQFVAQGWLPTSVPTTVLAALVANKVYPDPYYGDNLTKVPGYREGRWLVMPKDSPFHKPWWYRTEFTVPEAFKGKHITLHLDGINYRANIWLNGMQIADREAVIGMFRRFEFDVDEHVVVGKKNCLAVEIIAPGDLPEKRYRTKQLEATTGWDDHNPIPPDLNMGIWQNVYLRATGAVAIRHPYVATDLELPSLKKARLTVSARLINKTDKPVEGELAGVIESRKFSKPVKLGPNETREVAISPDDSQQLTIADPRVWWPNPVGSQELYDLGLKVSVNGQVSDAAATRFGIREATTYINDEGWRGYKVNGKNILIRGGAWMTCDMMLRLSERRYDALVRYAKEANLNMLRSEGFSIRETEEFYDICDRYGVMVTQQIFGRTIPDEKLAIACIEDMILRTRNHPSLVHFLGHDETFPSPTLDKAYRDLIAKYTPDRTYQPHSGAFRQKDRFKTGGTRTGSREVWTYAGPSHYYVSKETGAWGFAQSGGIGGVTAPIESMRKMMPAGALWPPWTDTWSLHTVIQTGIYYDAMLKAMTARYGEPRDIADFCMKGQLLNYESARGMFEAYGRNKYSATGITTWKYDAAWPASPTWQYIDWYLQAGGAYYGAQNACRALHVQYAYDDRGIYVVNGQYRKFDDLQVEAKVFNFDLAEKYSRTAKVSVDADGKVQVFAIEFPSGLSKTHFLSLTLRDASGKPIDDNFYWLSTVPDVPGRKYYKNRVFTIEPKSVADFTDLARLPRVRPKLTSKFETHGGEQVAVVTVENPTDKLAFFVHLAVTKGPGGPEVTPTFWHDNYVTLLPGQSRTLRATVYTRDLDGKKPTIKIDGPNIQPD